jgi:hypothetical protein
MKIATIKNTARLGTGIALIGVSTAGVVLRVLNNPDIIILVYFNTWKAVLQVNLGVIETLGAAASFPRRKKESEESVFTNETINAGLLFGDPSSGTEEKRVSKSLTVIRGLTLQAIVANGVLHGLDQWDGRDSDTASIVFYSADAIFLLIYTVSNTPLLTHKKKWDVLPTLALYIAYAVVFGAMVCGSNYRDENGGTPYGMPTYDDDNIRDQVAAYIITILGPGAMIVLTRVVVGVIDRVQKWLFNSKTSNLSEVTLAAMSDEPFINPEDSKAEPVEVEVPYTQFEVEDIEKKQEPKDKGWFSTAWTAVRVWAGRKATVTELSVNGGRNIREAEVREQKRSTSPTQGSKQTLLGSPPGSPKSNLPPSSSPPGAPALGSSPED